jgi:hypothetical protein
MLFGGTAGAEKHRVLSIFTKKKNQNFKTIQYGT